MKILGFRRLLGLAAIGGGIYWMQKKRGGDMTFASIKENVRGLVDDVLNKANLKGENDKATSDSSTASAAPAPRPAPAYGSSTGYGTSTSGSYTGSGTGYGGSGGFGGSGGGLGGGNNNGGTRH